MTENQVDINEDDLENLGPAIHLPDEEEYMEIVRKAVMESRLYEPFTLLEKRVIHSICIEKKTPHPENNKF